MEEVILCVKIFADDLQGTLLHKYLVLPFCNMLFTVYCTAHIGQFIVYTDVQYTFALYSVDIAVHTVHCTPIPAPQDHGARCHPPARMTACPQQGWESGARWGNE